MNRAYLDVSGSEETIQELLFQLPKNFRKEVGGGWSFLKACETEKGELWTGLHEKVEKLIMLGLAAKKVEFLLPRDYWQALPGGVPYLVVTS